MPQAQQEKDHRRPSCHRVAPSALGKAGSNSLAKPELQLQQRKQQQRQQRLRQRRSLPKQPHQSHNVSDDYMLSSQDDEDLYAARMKYLREKLPTQSRGARRVAPPPPPPPPMPFNFANSDGPDGRISVGQREGSKIILTYNQVKQAPTKDLQTLALVLMRQQIREEVLHLSEIVNEQNPFEMRNMRLNSFIANTPDVMDHWKVALLEEGMRIIDDSFDADDVSWVNPGSASASKFPMPMDELTLVSLPADKPEISKSQVATEYIQAQRGHQANEQDDATQLFQSEMLKAENAAAATPEMFERICACYKLILHKAVEIEYIEKKQDTCQAVDGFVEMLKLSVDRVVQEALTQNLVDAGEHGGTFVRVLASTIMDELHESHQDKKFEPMAVRISGPRQD